MSPSPECAATFFWTWKSTLVGHLGLQSMSNRVETPCRIDWCKGHWCSSTYMVVRLFDIGQKQPKNTKNAFFTCFCPYVRQPHDHIGWALSMPFASINPTKPRTNLWNFREKILSIGDFEKRPFWKISHFEFFFWKFVQVFTCYA